MCDTGDCTTFGHVYRDGACIMCGEKEPLQSTTVSIHISYPPVYSGHLEGKSIETMLKEFSEEIRKFYTQHDTWHYMGYPKTTGGNISISWDGRTRIKGTGDKS